MNELQIFLAALFISAAVINQTSLWKRKAVVGPRAFEIKLLLGNTINGHDCGPTTV